MLRRSNENETQLNRFQTLRYHPAHKIKKRGTDATGRFGRSGGSKNADSTRRPDMEIHGPGFVSGAAADPRCSANSKADRGEVTAGSPAGRSRDFGGGSVG